LIWSLRVQGLVLWTSPAHRPSRHPGVASGSGRQLLTLMLCLLSLLTWWLRQQQHLQAHQMMCRWADPGGVHQIGRLQQLVWLSATPAHSSCPGFC
jgi:hypothetical protein